MRGLRLRPLAAGLGLALGLLLGAGCEPPEGGGVTEPEPEAPRRAPDFTLPDLEGQEVTLSALRGRPVVVDFWATWCAPCVHQIPVLNAFQQAHPEVAVLGVAVDVDGREVVAPFAEEHGIAYRVLLGDERLARRYGAFGFPTLYLIDREGAVAAAHAGVVQREELEAALAGLEEPGGGGDGS
ncbi:MAG: TlpA disulfide reductase family protein [Myxococcota bacterium]|nr:TlpA disulfide reductase family protein [Myxococcota bacterium]